MILGSDFVCRQHLHDADMSKAAGCAAAEHEFDQRTFAPWIDGAGCEIGRGHLVS